MCIETEGGLLDVEVEYEWIPSSCSKCLCTGQVDRKCPTEEVWLPKKTSKEFESVVQNKNAENSVQENQAEAVVHEDAKGNEDSSISADTTQGPLAKQTTNIMQSLTPIDSHVEVEVTSKKQLLLMTFCNLMGSCY